MAGEQDRYREVDRALHDRRRVVTCEGPDGPAGLTTNAITSVSLEPLLLLVCFDNDSRTLPVVRESRRFAVNVLREGQEDLARVFASKRIAREKFESVTHTVEHGVPVLDGALAWLACDLRELLPGGDHTIGIGEVTQMDADRRRPPARSGTRAATRAWPDGCVRARLRPYVAQHPQRQERDHQRGDRHHAGLAAHDRPDDVVLALLRQLRRRRCASSRPRWSSTVCAEATRSCSAMIETDDRQQQVEVEQVVARRRKPLTSRTRRQQRQQARRDLARADRHARTRDRPRRATRPTRRAPPRRGSAPPRRSPRCPSTAPIRALCHKVSRAGCGPAPTDTNVPVLSTYAPAIVFVVLGAVIGIAFTVLNGVLGTPPRESRARRTRTSRGWRRRSSRASVSGSAST